MSKSKSTKSRVNRKLEAAKLAAAGSIAELAGGQGWIVASQTGRGSYTVRLESESPTSSRYSCNCPDSAQRGRVCKHQLSVILYQKASAVAIEARYNGTLVEAIASTTARAAQERDAFNRYALLCLLGALSQQQAIDCTPEHFRAA